METTAPSGSSFVKDEPGGLFFELRRERSWTRVLFASVDAESLDLAPIAFGDAGCVDVTDGLDAGTERRTVLEEPLERVLSEQDRFLNAVDPDDRPTVRAAVAELSDGQPIALQYRLVPENASSRIVRIEAYPFVVDGTIDRLVGVLRDVTGTCDRMSKIEQENERIEALHEIATEIGTMTDVESVYDATIEAAEDILAFDICSLDIESDGVLLTVSVASDMTIDEYYHEVSIDPDESLAGKTYTTGETYVIDDVTRTQYAPATPRYLSVLSVPVGDRGVFQAGAEESAAFDDTDRRMAELLAAHLAAAIERIEREEQLAARTRELEAKNQRLDEFTRFVSHDIRSPLNVAMGRLEMATERVEDENLTLVEDALGRIDDLIEDMLTLARHGQTIGETEPVDLEWIADQCWSGIETGDASLTVEVDRRLRADPDRLRQAIENLFRNSIDHAGEGVSIRLGQRSDGFYIEDDGPGIPDDERGDIFESGVTTGEGGTGLGLRIVEEIVDAHGWEIRVTEGTDGGARFEIRGVEWLEQPE